MKIVYYFSFNNFYPKCCWFLSSTRNTGSKRKDRKSYTAIIALGINSLEGSRPIYLSIYLQISFQIYLSISIKNYLFSLFLIFTAKESMWNPFLGLLKKMKFHIQFVFFSSSIYLVTTILFLVLVYLIYSPSPALVFTSYFILFILVHSAWTWEQDIKLRYNSCYLQTPPFVHTIYHPFIHLSFLPTYFSILYPIIHHSLFHSFIFHHTVPFILYTFFFMFSVILHALFFMFSVILYTFFFMFSVILYAFSLFLFHLHFSNV